MIMTGAAQINTSLLMLSVTSVLLPTVFHKAIRSRAIDGVNSLIDQQEAHDILAISHGVRKYFFGVLSCWADGCGSRLRLSSFSV